jgi:hypothetical protein
VSGAAPPVVPVFRDHFVRAWPTHAAGPQARYEPLCLALSSEYPTDAHFAAYSVQEFPRRLSRGALRVPPGTAPRPDGAPMQFAVFDVDCAPGHAGDLGAVEPWWRQEASKLAALLVRHPAAFIYRTRGGYRVLYTLDPARVLRTDEDAEAWAAQYEAWVRYLEREFAIQADPTCKDWTRLYRLPHATRERGGRPERREVIGDPCAIGAWTCDAPATSRPRRPRGWSAAPIPSGRSTTYGTAALRRATSEVGGARTGHRNVTVNAAAYSLGRLVAAGHLCALDVEEALVGACEANGYADETTESGIRSVIASGLAAGVAAGPRGPTVPWAREGAPR